MSAVEKVKKKKKGKGLATGKNKKTVDVAQETDNKQKIEELAADTVSHGSVISVQEAKDEAKQDYTEKEDDDKMSSPIQYEDSKQENDPEPTTSKNISRPTSVTSHRSGQLGSSASVQSKEAWTDNKICTVTPSDGKGRENSSRSLSSKEPSPLFVPPEMNESHAYVPFLYARDTIAKITEDMKKMKYKHVDIIREIDLNYKNIEDDTQTQFNMFVITMQQKYVQKVKTFRQVIDVHRMELQHKQQYWDEVIQSLSQRNKQLLNEKKQLLILNKQQHEKLEQEKEHVARDLMLKLDAKEKEIAKLKQLMRKKEHEFEEDKERELKNMENILRQEWDKEKRELEETIEDLKSNPNVVTESVQHSSAPGDAKVVSDLERKLREKDNMLLLCKRTASDREAELEKEKMILQQDVKRLEQQNSKLKKKQSGEVDSDSDLEKQIEDLENKVMELELALRAAELDKKHYMNINQDQKDYLSELEDQLKEADIRVQHLLMSADESEKAGSQLNNANRELDKLKRKAKRLEEELTAKSEEMADHDLKAEKLRSEMEKDMKKMLKEIAKLRKQVEEKEDPPQEPSQMEKKIEKMEGSVIDFEHKISILTSDRDYFSAKSKVLKDRVIELEEEVHLADKTIAQLRAKSAISDFYKKQYMETQQNVDDLKQKIKDLKQDLLYKQQELRDSQHRSEQALWQETKKQTKLVFDMKKLTKQIANLEKKLKKSETAASDDSENKDSEETINSLQDKLLEAEREHDLIKQQYKDMRARCQDLERRLVMAEENLEQNQHNEDVAASLEAAEAEVKALKQKIEVFENQLPTKQQEIEEKEADVKDKERKLKNIQLEHRDQLREKDKMIKELEKEIRKLKWQLAKLKEKLGLSDKDSAGEMGTDMNDLEDKVTELEKKIVDLEAEKELMKMENDSLKQANKQLEIVLHQQQETTEIQESGAPLAMSTPVPSDGSDIQELNQQIADLQKEVDQKEVEIIQERANHNVTREELERTTIQLEKLSLELENLKTESQARLETTETKLNTEIENLKQRLSESEKQREKLEADQVANIPPDTAVIINDLRVKLKAQEEEKTGLSKEKVELEAKIKTLQARINQLENTSKADKVSNTGIMDNLKQLRIEKDREIRQIQNEAQRKELQRAEQERKKINILEQKIKQLEEAGSGSTGKAQTGTQGLQALQARLREAKQEISELKSKNKRLENDLRRGSGATGGLAVDVEAEKRFKKQAKILKEMEKIVEMEQQKNKKNEERIKKLEEELKETQKNLKEKEQELEKLKAEMAALGVSAKAAKDLSQEVEKLKAEVSQLTKENKILAENFNSERILRKKYYNMVEDMKGKIRVYCRVRPMSKSELDRGNHSVIKSPDEYSVIVDSNRGPKEFQFDQVFMPEASQEKIFEDTNNLIQSAVDGYNVCIFAYGQTGSGKTYTIIGDREQKNPGIAPRAFERIFDLLQENKSKFSYKCSCYMLELYNDRLIDLFSKPAANAEDKLEIKKDQKGMVFVQGAAVKSAKNAQQLNALFEEGSKNRHTASTKMNLESSRSHLVIGIVIETTNRTTGALLKGKLSLVDLAGSERAAKTGASAEQLKEAMSINKSLSALGDVISALSSEQQFIPYRNNKLTMLMQDSLGGNAKTLMFVNVSPADYNADETVVSLTYASRVKLITNDAQKNAENKEIARLKNIIAKLKKGETAPEAEEVV